MPEVSFHDLLSGLGVLADTDTFFSNLDSTPSARDLHHTGLQMMAQGYLAQAETCFRAARCKAQTENLPNLTAMITIDLARSMHERHPRYSLGLLKDLKPGPLTYVYRRSLINNLACSLKAMCHFDHAHRFYLTLYDIASEQKDPLGMACSSGNRADILSMNGAHTEASRMNSLALELLTDAGETTYAGLVANNMANNAMHRGDYDESLRLFETAVNHARTAGNLKLGSHVYANKGELELILGERESGRDSLRLANRMAGAASLPTVSVQTLLLRNLADGNLTHLDLLDAAVASARDLHARKLYLEAAPVVVLAGCLADSLGHDPNECFAILNDAIANSPMTTLLARHYQRVLAALKRPLDSHRGEKLAEYISNSASISRIKSQLVRLIDTDVRILLEGESGTGKSFLAKQVHKGTVAKKAPFVIVDCTNLDEHLFESKLFGHLRGAFTGAVADRIGLVEEANGGTLFLDEIGELPTEIQGKLLYVIEEQRYRPVGAKSERQANIRVIAATNRDVGEMLSGGTIRSDLFFRLAGFRIHLPPLRERREDIVPLTEHRLKVLNERYGRRKSLRYDTWPSLLQYSWPGNVRELNTALERGYHLSSGRRISWQDLGLGQPTQNDDADSDLSWYSVRRSHLLHVLRLCHGNVSRAAVMLGLNRTTLIYKLGLLGISRNEYVPSAQE